MADEPALFRVLLEVADLRKARVIVGIVDVAASGETPVPAPQDFYFAVSDLEAIHARANALECLYDGNVHGEPAGDIVVRPWGERSFYALDPYGNGLCFVDKTTLFTGLRS